MTQTDNINSRVADAMPDNWVYRWLPRVAWPYAQLARLDRPIGWQLLMWPCFWSAALAADVEAREGIYHALTLTWHLALFFVGAVAMRGAGCTYNDLVDHEIDMAVARTRSRPLPSGRVTRFQAKMFILAQALVGLLVLLQFNWFSVILGVASLATVAVYPFAKRFTDWPQFFLGLAFSWGALMGWATAFGSLSAAAVVLYAAAIAWTIGYDTIYALQDKEDDALIGVRSTALLFGNHAKQWISGLFGLTLGLLLIAFVLAGVPLIGYAGLAIAAVLFGYQILVLDMNDAAQCLALFKLNSKVGAIIFLGLMIAAPFA